VVCGDESISLGISLNNDLVVCRGNEHANYVSEQPKKGILRVVKTDMLFVRSPLVDCKNVDPRIAPQHRRDEQNWPKSGHLFNCFLTNFDRFARGLVQTTVASASKTVHGFLVQLAIHATTVASGVRRSLGDE
jgi:hypothetical protein